MLYVLMFSDVFMDNFVHVKLRLLVSFVYLPSYSYFLLIFLTVC